MAYIDVLFPDFLSYGAASITMFRTEVVMPQGGSEQRNRKWRNPLRRFDVGMRHLPEAETQALVAFFQDVARGKLNVFPFHDFTPGHDAYIPVRFDVDTLRMTRDAPDAWSWDSVPLVEVRLLTSGPNAGQPVSDRT